MEKQQQPLGKRIYKQTAHWSRWFHLYLSMVSFLILLFFAITGITLNHTEWFADQQKTTTLKDTVPMAWVEAKLDTIAIKKLEIVERFRNKFGIKGALTEFIIDEYQCTVSFNGPGYAVAAFVNRENGIVEINETYVGWVGVLNDLHKGRDTGSKWKWLIDISAVLMILVSITGLMMLFFLKSKRIAGLAVIIVGGILCWLVYYFGVQ
ncbi:MULTISPECIES: PepSY-associated TM helix domain-containing protein [unclassified Paraflavitalea]|uniref:PepSY-associated TM helix domain-containing protein n=1 Tax=unclassified Paraflavitalea TaxID=2798305 RepID=UPI003D32DD03